MITGDERHTTGTQMIAALAANGVTEVFGIPGTHTLELHRGLRLGCRGVKVDDLDSLAAQALAALEAPCPTLIVLEDEG